MNATFAREQRGENARQKEEKVRAACAQQVRTSYFFNLALKGMDIEGRGAVDLDDWLPASPGPFFAICTVFP